MITLLLQPLKEAPGETEGVTRALNAPGVVASLSRPFSALAAGESAARCVRGEVADPTEAVGILLSLLRRGGWAVGLIADADPAPGEREGAPAASGSRAQDVDSPGGGEVPLSEDDRRLLARAHASRGRCAVDARGGDASAARRSVAESALQLLGVLEARRSEAQQEAGRRIESGASQREAAETLGVSQQAVHARLQNGNWHETRALAAGVAQLLAELTGGSAGAVC